MEQNTVSVTLLELPWKDILEKGVLPYLRLRDLFCLRRASKDCYRLVTDYFEKAKYLDLSSDCDKFNYQAFAVVVNNNSHFTRLTLVRSKWLTDDYLVTIFTACSATLICVDFTSCSGITDATLKAIGQSCPKLKRLILKDCHWCSPEGLAFIVNGCKELECLELRSCWDIGDGAVEKLVATCPNLKYLSLAKIYGITDQSMRAIAHRCSKLEHLDVSGCWRITDNGITLVGEYCNHLRYLCVTDCRDVSDSSLIRLRIKKVEIDRPVFPLPGHKIGSYFADIGLYLQI